MTTMKLTAIEAKQLRAKRAKNKARNAVLYEIVDAIKRRVKHADALEAGTLHAVLADLRKMVR